MAINLEDSAEIVAPQLLGWELVVEKDGVRTGGVIVETEAYAERDESSHTFKGRTARNDVMFERGGRVYVYFTYGMHFCMNITTGRRGQGEAVLLRALEPTIGIEEMWQRRYGEAKPRQPDSKRLHNLTSGPAKLVRAAGIDASANGVRLNDDGAAWLRVSLRPKWRDGSFAVAQTARIGITRAVERPWRWYVSGNAWVSRA